MRTLVGAAEPPERPRAVVHRGNASSTTSNAHVVLAYAEASGLTLAPWQAVVIHYAYRTKRV